MSNLKKTIKLVSKVLSSDKKRQLYTQEELEYMKRQVDLMKEQKQRRKLQRKLEKGFGE